MRRHISLLTLCLGLALSPALYAASETNHNFSKWEKEISAYEQSDATNFPGKGVILFIGSSTIRRWNSLGQDFPGHHVLNRGFGGSEIVDSTHFAERIIFPYEPKQVFLRAGGNDLWAGKTPEQVFEDFKEFAGKLHSRLPETEIVFISLCPSIARWSQAGKERKLDELARDFCAGKPYLKYVETYSTVLGSDGRPKPELFVQDKLHFSPAGYKLLADAVRPYLEK